VSDDLPIGGRVLSQVCAELKAMRAERDAARAEAQKLRGWVREAEQAAGREQRRAEQAEAEVAALKGGWDAETAKRQVAGFNRMTDALLEARAEVARRAALAAGEGA
jgi:hypothetical protein